MRRLNILAATVAVSCSFLTGCQVRSPGSFETRLMQGTKRRITVGGRSDANPLASTNENIRAGQRNFASYCMVCHGLDGQTTGVPFADRMAPPVPPLNSASVQAYTDGPMLLRQSTMKRFSLAIGVLFLIDVFALLPENWFFLFWLAPVLFIWYDRCMAAYQGSGG